MKRATGMARFVPLLLLAGCGGHVAHDCEGILSGTYDATFTVLETDCPNEHVGDVSSGRVTIEPSLCHEDGCTLVCDTGPTETTWEVTGPGQARVAFEGACRIVYSAALAPVSR